MTLIPGASPTPEDFLRLLAEARERTLRIIAPLTAEELRAQHDSLMSPMIWDLGHIGHFEEVWLLEKLCGGGLATAGVRRAVGAGEAGRPAQSGDEGEVGPGGVDGSGVEVGVEVEGEGLRGIYNPFQHPRATRDRLPLPAREEALDYLERVRKEVRERLVEVDFDPADPLQRDGFAIALVLQHEYQHNETIFQTLQLMKGRPYPGVGGGGGKPLPVEGGSAATADAAADPAAGDRAGTGTLAEDVREMNGGSERQVPEVDVLRMDGAMVRFPGGEVPIGTDDRSVAYDNERPLHIRTLAPFWIDAAPVTNAAFQRFIEDGGYRTRDFWSDAGWSWRGSEGVRAPLHWRAGRSGEWKTRIMGVERSPDPHAPVCHVSYYEAEAYARYVNRRLLTEVEWEAAATWDPEAGVKRLFPWGDEPPTPDLANLDALRFEPAPVGAYTRNCSPIGCIGMIGDTWEWTSTDFDGYPGFRSFPYREYSEVFFGSEYKVLRGGSWATRPGAIRGTFRNWDYPIRRQIFSGIRCARDD